MAVAVVVAVAVLTGCAGCAHTDVAPAVAMPPTAEHHDAPGSAPPNLVEALGSQSAIAATQDAAPALAQPKPARAAAPNLPEPPFRKPLDQRDGDLQAVSKRLANASPAQCRAELQRRKLPVARVGGNVSGVATPVRLTGELRRVRFAAPGRKSVYGILDCRLAVVLDELAILLAQHGVAAVHVDNFYRPRARLGGRKKKSQHAYGLAIDIYGFTLADGTTLEVERDFHGTLGAPACGPEAQLAPGATAAALPLRNITCAIGRSRLFNHLLTPNYNTAHKNHLHADIQRDAREYIVR